MAVSAVVGCSGDILAPANPIGEASPFNEASAIAQGICQTFEAPLKRLTNEQYRNSLKSIIEDLPEATRSTVWRTIEPTLVSLPTVGRNKRKPYSSQERATSNEHVLQYLRIAETVAAAITQDQERLQQFVGCRPGSPRSCLEPFLRRLASKAFHRSASDDELSSLFAAYVQQEVSAEAVRDLLIVVLNAPQFLYQIELGTTGGAQEVALSGAEFAGRLAFSLWQAPPDASLLAEVTSERLTESNAEHLVDVVLRDARSRVGLERFVREWLDLDELPDLDGSLGTPGYDGFVGDDVPSSEMRDDMIGDVVSSLAWHLGRGDSYDQWLLSPYAFAKTPDLSAIYGVPLWNPSHPPPLFPAGERAGLVTRAAMLASGDVRTRPILKGVRLRERLLCAELPPPDPAAANGVPRSRDVLRTTREDVERLTEQQNTSCIGCHTTSINGLGFATENYDGLGRIRSFEKIYDEAGNQIAEKLVNTRSMPRLMLNDMTIVSGSSELAERLAASDVPEACFSRQMARFLFGVTSETADCIVEGVPRQAASMLDTVRSLLLSKEFRSKHATTEQQSSEGGSTP